MTIAKPVQIKPATLFTVINFAGFQLIWFAAVLGAAHEILWPCVLLTVAFCAWQLSSARRHPNDLRLILWAVMIGFVVDSLWQFSGMIRYASSPMEPLAPTWIIMLWVAFALTFNHSLAWLKQRPTLALAFGFFGSPLSYWAGSKLGALEYLSPIYWVSLAFALSWAVIVWFLCRQARHPQL